MTPSPQQRWEARLDKILKNFDERTADLRDQLKTGTLAPVNYNAKWDLAEKSLNAAIDKAVAEIVIGDDGNENLLGGVVDRQLDAKLRLDVKTRNQLRAEQRTIIGGKS